jgi:hypothetical protein
MDGNIGGDIEAQDHGTALDAEYRDFEKALKAIAASDYNRLLSFSR